jgi:hypothetical protein
VVNALVKLEKGCFTYFPEALEYKLTLNRFPVGYLVIVPCDCVHLLAGVLDCVSGGQVCVKVRTLLDDGLESEPGDICCVLELRREVLGVRLNLEVQIELALDGCGMGRWAGNTGCKGQEQLGWEQSWLQSWQESKGWMGLGQWLAARHYLLVRCGAAATRLCKLLGSSSDLLLEQ